ncbi:hypothetical protein [Streptomyces sp. NPDC001450]
MHERLESGGTRRIRGIAAQAILVAFQLAHANKRKLAAWADAITLNGDHPAAVPTDAARPNPGHLDPRGIPHRAREAREE